MEPEVEINEGGLNEHQKRHLRVTCQYVDKLLADIESILNSSASKAAFPRYVLDVSPAQRRTLEDYIARIRAQLLRVLESQDIYREPPSIPASRAVHVDLGSIDIALFELKPRYMRGYGPVPEDLAREVEGIVGELQGLVGKLNRFVLNRTDQDFKARLERLSETKEAAQLLATIERVVASRGLVEFRPTIASILDRMEDRSLEIAVFGRVSSGKSSLLNSLLETQVLPIGVTPITAVPTRIAYATEPKLTVWFADRPLQTVPADRLSEYATEQQNPGNEKRVSRILLQLPAARLRDGVTFVDTPGLGSLATGGAEETLAYLPRCDLAILLIDAGSTLTPGDLDTLQALLHAAIPVHVLLSKADLLSSADLERLLQYVGRSITEQCGAELPIIPVSAIDSHRYMLDRWFQAELFPLYGRASELRSQSIRRKIGALRESVAAVLRAQGERSRAIPDAERERIRQTEATLRKITGKLEQAGPEIETDLQRLKPMAWKALEDSAGRVLAQEGLNSERTIPVGAVFRDDVLRAVRREAQEIHERLQTLAEDAAIALSSAAETLDLPQPAADEDDAHLLRGMPVFEPGPVDLEFRPPRLVLRLGGPFAQRALARRLESKLRNQLLHDVEVYGDVLKVWCESSIGQIKRWFASQADSYRAQADRLLGTAGASSHQDDISQDLKQLADRVRT
jgi:GTP-binding protein EngB required for normal cell division